MRRTSLFLALIFTLFAIHANAQNAPVYFGKNPVNWDNIRPEYYASEHFDVRHYGFDLKDERQKEYLEEFIGNLEGNYRFLRTLFNHDIEGRIPVMVFATHHQFETGAVYLVGQFLPEGVGALAERIHGRIYTKEDLRLPQKAEANCHELTHRFQYDMLPMNIRQRFISGPSLPGGFFEGAAEYFGLLCEPLSDNPRKVHQRMASALLEMPLSRVQCRSVPGLS